MYREFQRHDSESNMNLQAPKYVLDEQAACTLLQYMNSEQLEEYLNGADKIDTLIADLHQTKVIQKDRANIIVKNKSLAEFNLSLQPKFDTLKQKVASAYEEVNALKVALGQDVAKLDLAPGCQSHDTLLAIFQTEAATTDEQSEEVAEDFCDGKLDLDTFISQYLPSRTEAYVRKAKIEKVGDLLRQDCTSTSSVPYPTNSVPQNNYAKQQTGNMNTGYRGAGYGMGNTPYPPPAGSYGGGSMPMPSHYQR